MPYPFGKEMWPWRIIGLISTSTSAFPRSVMTRARSPSARPKVWASASEIRSAPSRSRLRHSGDRKMVFAVNERRSPADSTNG